MSLFTIFIFGAVVIGAGGMLSPAWPTSQPRIGLAATLALGVVIGGGIVYSMLFGWDTLVIDYLLFAVVTTIFLGGTLSFGQQRVEARGEDYTDADAGWPGPHDLIFFGFVALIFAIPAMVLPVPLDTDAQGFGYLALTARLGGGFQTLAPFHPEISYLYAPGWTLLTAYLSDQLGLGLHTIQMSVGAVLGLLFVWLAYDFGGEIQDKRLGRTMAVAALVGVGLYTAYMDSHFTTLLALCFALAFLTYAIRYLREHKIGDAIAAGLMLGSVMFCHPDTTIILALGYAPFLLTMWLAQPKPTPQVWLVLALGVPLIALVGVSAWLFNIRDLLGAPITSPFERDPNYWQVMVLYHGVIIVPISIIGAVVGLKQRRHEALLAVGWLLFVLDFAVFGIIESVFGGLLGPILRYDYPFSIAWHGPIIPYTILGGIGLLWLWDRVIEPRLSAPPYRAAYGVLATLIVLAFGVLAFNRQILEFSKGRVGFFGAFSSHADVEAMTWLRDNTPTDSRVLNFPGPQEGDWVPVIAERDSVYYRMQPFFQNAEASLAEQERLRAFWLNPADADNAALLSEHSIDYVIVPHVVTNPNSIEIMYRWRVPFTEALEMRSSVSDADYLQLVFDADGAQVYEFSGLLTAVSAAEYSDQPAGG